MAIYDLNGVPLRSASFVLRSNQTYDMKILIDCIQDYILEGISVPNVVITAKRELDVPFVDIENTPIDLSSWDGTLQQFHIKWVTGTLTIRDRQLVPFRVRYNG